MLLPASLSPNARTGIQQPAMLESEDNSSLPGKVVLPGQGWVLVLEPFGLCKHSDHKVPASSLGRSSGPPTQKGGADG